MRVLGIDPGSVATGFGVIQHTDGRIVHLAHGTLRPPRGAELSERLAFLYRGLCEVLDQYAADIAAVEQVFVARNPKAAVVLGQARGALLAALGGAGLGVSEYSPREVKQSVTGSGAASKDQVQAMVVRTLDLPAVPQSDAADALAVAICHASAGRLRELGVTRRRGRRAPRFAPGDFA